MANLHWNDVKLLDNLRDEIMNCPSGKKRMRALLENKGFILRQTSNSSDHLSIYWGDWGDRLGGFAPNKSNEKGFRMNVAKQLVSNIQTKLAALAAANMN